MAAALRHTAIVDHVGKRERDEHSISWKDAKCDMVGAIPADITMEKRPQGRGYVQLEETEDSLWPDPEKRVTCHPSRVCRSFREYLTMKINIHFLFGYLNMTSHVAYAQNVESHVLNPMETQDDHPGVLIT